MSVLQATAESISPSTSCTTLDSSVHGVFFKVCWAFKLCCLRTSEDKKSVLQESDVGEEDSLSFQRFDCVQNITTDVNPFMSIEP